MSDYVLSWVDRDEPYAGRGSRELLNWHEKPYQTQRSCAEALLRKPDDGTRYYVNGVATSRATAQRALDFYERRDREHEVWAAEQRRIAAAETERLARLEQARVEAVAARLKGIFGFPAQSLPERFWLEVAEKAVESYKSVKEV